MSRIAPWCSAAIWVIILSPSMLADGTWAILKFYTFYASTRWFLQIFSVQPFSKQLAGNKKGLTHFVRPPSFWSLPPSSCLRAVMVVHLWSSMVVPATALCLLLPPASTGRLFVRLELYKGYDWFTLSTEVTCEMEKKKRLAERLFKCLSCRIKSTSVQLSVQPWVYVLLTVQT